MNMKIITTIVTLLFAVTVHASPISCELSNEDYVQVTMSVPHPEHAIVHRPNDETVWIQSSPDFIHKQIDNFSQLSSWVITSESTGTVWVEGKPTIQPIINGNGRYHLYISDNPETEKENTYFIECYFIISGKNA